MNNTIKWVIGAVILVGVVWLGYNYSRPSEPVSREPIKIGATLALSGKLAFIGEQEANGLKTAVEEINSEGGINGRKIRLIIEDNQGEAKNAASNASKLLNLDKVDIIYSAFTHVTNAIKNLVAKSGKVMIYSSSLRDIAESSPLFFRDYVDAGDDGRFLAKLVNEQGYKKIGFLTEISDACESFESGFNQEGEKYGIKILVREAFSPKENDLKTPLIKVKKSKPEAIALCTWRQEHVLMKQLKELGMIGIQTFHWVAPFLPSADTPEMKKLFEENKAISTWYGTPESDYSAEQKKFADNFLKRYGSKPRIDVFYSYDDIHILANALKRCDEEGKVRDSNCIAGELLKTDYNGLGGKLKFNKDGVSIRNTYAITVKNGEWTEIPIE